jgi:HUS1 checkpoint protein
MRFRASIQNVATFFSEQHMSLDYVYIADSLGRTGIIQTVEKVQKKFIAKFSESTLQIICNDRNNPGEVQIWS